MSDMPLVHLTQDALVLALSRAIPDVTPTRDSALPQGASGRVAFMNVVLSGRPPEVQAEAMGLVEDESEIEYVQTFNVEWIVRDGDDVPEDDDIATVARRALFGRGLAAIDAAVRFDRTLGGLAHGLTVGPPQYDVNPLVGSPTTMACLVPVRAALRGTSLLA